ncbi:MAG: hypothetical protein IPK19_29695 [Chloroflexi bacterium]|nr:hypothetical protein [Chloroflexota bacterium]
MAVAQTAYANRQHYRMVTTWLPHLLTNSLSLLLPDLVRALFAPRYRPRTLIEDTLITMVRDNPRYAVYVAPLAVGYILSHPRFNIYKGAIGDLRVGGMGLDAIPHSATAFTFSVLVADTFDTMGKREQYRDVLARFVQWGSQNPEVASLLFLALITLNWEYGEYRVHEYELALKGDASLINLQWSMQDTLRDVGANLFGWFTAMLWRRTQTRRTSARRIPASGSSVYNPRA